MQYSIQQQPVVPVIPLESNLTSFCKSCSATNIGFHLHSTWQNRGDGQYIFSCLTMCDLDIFLVPPGQSKLLMDQHACHALPTITENDLSDSVFLRQTAAAASQYFDKVTALYCHTPPLATLQDVKIAETYHSALQHAIDQSTGNLFDRAIRQYCTQKQHSPPHAPLTADEMEVRDAGDKHTQNMLAHRDCDQIFPPTNASRMPVPSAFPRTVHDLRCLRDGALLREIEYFYGLASVGDLVSRIHNVRRVYGIVRFARAPVA